MTYGDFSSLIQLGVGLHAGTALFQVVSEFGIAPIEKRIDRVDQFVTTSLPNSKTLIREVRSLKAKLSILNTKAHLEYKKFVQANFVVAALLLLCLVAISFNFGSEISYWFAIPLSLACFLPAAYTVWAHWRKMKSPLAKLKKSVEACEKKAFAK